MGSKIKLPQSGLGAKINSRIKKHLPPFSPARFNIFVFIHRLGQHFFTPPLKQWLLQRVFPPFDEDQTKMKGFLRPEPRKRAHSLDPKRSINVVAPFL